MTTLNHPTNGSNLVRTAWAELKEAGKDEGIKKTTGLQALLLERSDMFEFTTTDRGYTFIGLTEGAQVLDPADGLPPNILGSDGSLEHEAGFAAPEKAEDEGGGAESSASTAPAAPTFEKAEKGKGKGKTMQKGPSGATWVWNQGYRDLVWTPEMAAKKEGEKTREDALAWALYRAVEMHGGANVTLSQLGSDFKVAELKKDPHFKNWRLLDILKAYDDVFELTPAVGVAGGMQVRLQPGAEAALPGADKIAEQVSDELLILPERIDNPKSMVDKVQALRIELIHALHRRGGKCAIQELGQEPRLQEKKKMVHQAKKLVDWVKLFSTNFTILNESSSMMVEILSTDVKDMSAIDRVLGRDQDRGGGSRGKGGGRNDRGRSRSRSRGRGGGRDRGGRDRDRGSSSQQPPMGYPGYGYAPPGYPPPGYGYPGYPPAGYPPPGYPAAPAGPFGAPPGGYQQPVPDGAAYMQGQPALPAPGQQPPGQQPQQPPGGQPPGYPAPAGYPPQPGYQQPPAGYQAPPGGYQAPPAGYPAPAGYPGYPPPQ